MGIGLGVFLIVIGGILSFTTLDNSLLKTNLDVVGYILMIGGLLALIFGTIQNRQRANTSHTSVVERRNIEEGNVQHDVHEVRGRPPRRLTFARLGARQKADSGTSMIESSVPSAMARSAASRGSTLRA